MKKTLITASISLLLLGVAPASNAQVGLTFGFNTCGYPAYNDYCPSYAPPVGIYFGGGTWGDDRRFHGGGRGDRGGFRGGAGRGHGH